MKKILVIEDNEEVNENICEILELSGYEVYSANDGKKGVELAINKLPDLILCDVMMPDLDGYGVLKILSKNELASTIPLIFLTAKSEKKDLRKGMNLGAADYILKPFDDTDLLESIEIRLAQNDRSIQKGRRAHIGINGLDNDKKISELKNQWIKKYEVRSYPAKSEIYAIDKTAQFLYFIIKGVVRSHYINELGKGITLNIYGPNTFVGDRAIIQNLPYSHNTTAVVDSEIVLIPKQEFLDLLNTDSSLALHLYLSSSIVVESMQNALAEMAYGSVRRRVAAGLVKYASAHHSMTLCDGMDVSVQREELAELVGSAKETIIRTLSDFKSEGLIELDNHRIILMDIEALIHMPK